MRRAAGFRTLPQMYPSGQKWTAEDNKLYKPITKDIVDGVTLNSHFKMLKMIIIGKQNQHAL
jgi:hypothetical protein